MNIEKAFLLGLEFSALCREENKIIRQPQQSYNARLDKINSRKNAILLTIYHNKLKENSATKELQKS